MNVIKIKYTEKLENYSWINVTRIDKNMVVGRQYSVIEWGNNTYIKPVQCVAINVIDRTDLNDQISFLDENCDLEIYRDILAQRGMGDAELYQITTFSNLGNSKKYSDAR